MIYNPMNQNYKPYKTPKRLIFKMPIPTVDEARAEYAKVFPGCDNTLAREAFVAAYINKFKALNNEPT